MVQRTIVQTWCDVDSAEEAVRFTFMVRGVTYEIDLCERHAKEMDGAMEPFISTGRRIGGRRSSGGLTRAAATPRQASVPTPSAPVDGYGKVSNDLDKDARTRVRNWAKENGFEVGDRGRISQDIYNAYQEAHA